MGALTQLVAYGEQDVFLTGDPQRSLWKRNTIRRTNFAIESIETVFDLGFSGPSFITISRAGDLIKSCVLQITMMKSSIPSFYPAEQFVKNISVMIGGQEIEVIQDFPNWNRVNDELFNDTEIRAANYRMLNFRDDDPAGAIRTFYLDLPLFFTRYLSTALPLIALQYHEVQLKITFQDPSNIPGIDPSYTPTARFYADYIFLDRPERAYFGQNPHEYIIEQVQTINFPPNVTEGLNSSTYDIPFNLPTRYLIWFYKSNLHGQYTTSNNTFENNEAYAPLHSAIIRINGVDRFSRRPGGYFNLVQSTQGMNQAASAGIYVYSFGVNAGEQDSAGTLNFSRLDMVTLGLTTKAATAATIADITNLDVTLSTGLTKFNNVVVFGKNFNVLRVMEGMGGLLFSN